MQLLATYTFGQALLTVLELCLLFLWLWMAVAVVIDVFRSHDLSGWAKAGWLVLIVLVPLLGVLIYVIARNDKMKAHQVSDERQQEIASIAELEDLKDRGILTDEEFQRVYSRRKLTQKAPPSPDDDIAGLEGLRDRGLLTDAEFQRAKDKALAA
jgi:phospholipase D-like protein/putative oligomerization/nucleic acid binding protein